MAKKIVISNRAQAQRLQILDYWYQRTGSKNYSRKLDIGFRKMFQLILKYPSIGRFIEPEDSITKLPSLNMRAFVYLDDQIIYALKKDGIVIHQIWDTRQNSNKK